jgi:hypothetical protein
MGSLKDWARQHSYEQIVSSIESAEKTSFTASELIIKYSETLKFLKSRLPDSVPSGFIEEIDHAILVGLQAVETVEYPEKTRSLFSLG